MFISLGHRDTNLKKQASPILILSFLLLSIANFVFITQPLLAHLPGLTFWKNHVSKLAFTTPLQSILASNCSSALTIQSQNWLGTSINVGSNLTVNLSSVGSITFYSDSSCTTTTTTAMITAGTSSVSVYFISATTGSKQLTASAPEYASANQSETISTNPYVWTGGGGDANWNTGANWSGGAVPGAAHSTVFNDTCVSNCSPTINTSISIGGLRMANTYTGTLTQGSGNTITVGTAGWNQLAGQFMGGNSSITLNGPFTLSGGTFTSTSAVLTKNSGSWTVLNSPSFNHNSGTVYFETGITITPGPIIYKNVTFNGIGVTYNLGGVTMTVSGDLVFNNNSSVFTNSVIDSGTFLVQGNVTSTGNTTAGFSGTAVVQLTGNALGQTITSTTPNNRLPIINIDTGTNAVTLSTYVTLTGLTMTSVGTFTTTGSNLNFIASTTIAPGSVTYNNVSFGEGIVGGGLTFSLSNATMNINGNLTLTNNGSTTRTLNSGTLKVYGDIISNGSGTGGFSGSAIVQAAGNPLGQTISTNNQTNTIPNLVIETVTHPVTFGTYVSVYGSFTFISSGVFTTTGSTLIFPGSVTIIPGTVTYNNVTFGTGTGGGYSYTLSSGTMNIGGTLNLNNNSSGTPNTINSGIVMAYGDIVAGGGTGNGYTGTAIIQAAGNVSGQTITSNNLVNTIPNLVIAAGSNPITFGSFVSIIGSYTMTSVGTLSSAGSTLYFKSGLTLIPGTVTYGHIIFPQCGTYSLNSGTLKIGGDLTFLNPCGGTKITINSGTINLSGNLNSTGTPGVDGNASLAFVGSSNQTITVSGGAALPTGNVTVQTSGGASVYLGSAVTWNNAAQSLNVTSGSINMAGFALTVKSLSMNSNTLTKASGTLTVNGTVAGTGSLYGGTINP